MNPLAGACVRGLKKWNVPSDMMKRIIGYWVILSQEELLEKKVSDELEAIKVALCVPVYTAMWDIKSEEILNRNEKCFTLQANDYALFQLPEEPVVEYLEFCLADMPYVTMEDVERCTMPPCNGTCYGINERCKNAMPHLAVDPPVFSGVSPRFASEQFFRRVLFLLRGKGGRRNTILQEAKKRSVSVRVSFGENNQQRCVKVTVEGLLCVRETPKSVCLDLLKEQMTKTRT